MKIEMTNPNIRYCGRIDRLRATAPIFYYAGSSIEFNFTGTAVAVTLCNENIWGDIFLGVVIDGEVKKIPLYYDYNGDTITFKVCTGLEPRMHKLIIYKAYGGNHYFTLKGLEIFGGTVIAPDPQPKYRMEVYGDSVCCGEVCEAVDYVGMPDPENHNSAYDNVWYSFVMQTARNINASIHNVSQGGLALFDNTGYYHMPNTIGLQTIYDKLCYIPEAGDFSKWDFTKYIPDIVVIAVGQNDAHNSVGNVDDLDISDPSYRNRWKNGYMNIVRKLTEYYGSETKFVLTTTILKHNPEWDNAIQEITETLSAEGIKVFHNVFTRNGQATDGHPRIPEHNEMAAELTEFIKKNVLL